MSRTIKRSDACRTRSGYLCLGSNAYGPTQQARALLLFAVAELANSDVQVVAASRIFKTSPIGGGRQPDYLNIVIKIEGSLPAARLLRRLKAIERRAGRRFGRHWGPRPLDIDIVDFGGRVLHWPSRRAGILTLPHPEMHRRAFVLVPLLDVAPHWQHPALRVCGRRLLTRITGARAGSNKVEPMGELAIDP